MRVFTIDTSAWIAFFRNRPLYAAQRVTDLLSTDDAWVFLDGVVMAEVLQGVRNQTEKNRIEKTLGDLKLLPLNRETFKLAGNLNNSLRKKGVTLPLTDAIIAATAISNKATVLTLDKHFEHFAGLKVELIKP